MKLRSIRSKFILILSVLMAMILALQFYFTSQTQQDVLNELEKLSQSINQTTGRLAFDELPIPPQPQPSGVQVQKEDENVVIAPGTGQAPVKRKYSYSYNRHIAKNGDSTFFVVRNSKSLPVLLGTIDNSTAIKRLDSLETVLGTIEININDSIAPKTIARASGISSAHGRSRSESNQSVFTFSVPNFSRHTAPQIVRYNYNTAELDQALSEVRNHNLLVTLALFVTSLVVVVIIAGSFVKPIGKLNKSFDKVVGGDLNVHVDAKTEDEIGELSRAFNKMVVELKKNKDKEAILNRQERLASLGQLAAGVAHEIKNPLNAINLTIGHLKDKFVSGNDIQAVRYIAIIQNEIQRLDKTVNNFLSYLRSENLNKKPADMNKLCDEILTLYEHEFNQKNISVVRDYMSPCVIEMDTERIKTVLTNIILNSIQAIEKNGQISLKSNVEKNAKILVIEDSGTGIEPKHMEHIFDLFYTTKSGGTGLGLPTSYKIMQEHGGHIDIENNRPRGTCVTLRFP